MWLYSQESPLASQDSPQQPKTRHNHPYSPNDPWTDLELGATIGDSGPLIYMDLHGFWYYFLCRVEIDEQGRWHCPAL